MTVESVVCNDPLLGDRRFLYNNPKMQSTILHKDGLLGNCQILWSGRLIVKKGSQIVFTIDIPADRGL